MKTCLIEQSCGLGDILFSIKIAHFFAESGYKVIWPVEKIYSNIKNNINVLPNIEFPCVDENFEYKDLYLKLRNSDICNITNIEKNILYVPLRKSYYSDYGVVLRKIYQHDECAMLSKHGMCNLDYKNWQNFFSIKRNYNKESELMKILGIEPNEQIHLINKEFGTPPKWSEILKREIETPQDLKKVEMKILDGYDLFDWISIFEMAKRIDTVSTSNFYIFEKIDLQCIPTIYSKNNSHKPHYDNWGWMEKIASKKYNFVN